MGAYVGENLLFVSSSTTEAFAAQKLERPTRCVLDSLLNSAEFAAPNEMDLAPTGSSFAAGKTAGKNEGGGHAIS